MNNSKLKPSVWLRNTNDYRIRTGYITGANKLISDWRSQEFGHEGSFGHQHWFSPTYFRITLTIYGSFVKAEVYESHYRSGLSDHLVKTYNSSSKHFPRWLNHEISLVCAFTRKERYLKKMTLAELHDYVRVNGYYKANIDLFRNYKRDCTHADLVNKILEQEGYTNDY